MMLTAALLTVVLGFASAAPAPNGDRPVQARDIDPERPPLDIPKEWERVVHVRAPGNIPKDWEYPPPSLISGNWWVSHTTGKANDGRRNLQINRDTPHDSRGNFMQIDTRPGAPFVETLSSRVNYKSTIPILSEVSSYTDASGKLHSLYGYDFFPSEPEIAAKWQFFPTGSNPSGNYTGSVLAWGYDNETWQYMLVAIGPSDALTELTLVSRRKGGPDNILRKALIDGLKALKNDRIRKLVAGGWHLRPTDETRDGQPGLECTDSDCWGNVHA